MLVAALIIVNCLKILKKQKHIKNINTGFWEISFRFLKVHILRSIFS